MKRIVVIILYISIKCSLNKNKKKKKKKKKEYMGVNISFYLIIFFYLNCINFIIELINLRLYAKAIIVRAWKRYLDRKTFQILKNSLYEMVMII